MKLFAINILINHIWINFLKYFYYFSLFFYIHIKKREHQWRELRKGRNWFLIYKSFEKERSSRPSGNLFLRWYPWDFLLKINYFEIHPSSLEEISFERDQKKMVSQHIFPDSADAWLLSIFPAIKADRPTPWSNTPHPP